MLKAKNINGKSSRCAWAIASTVDGMLLILFRCARKPGCHTFRIDVEGQEYQRLVAWVSPLVHEGVRFIDQGTWSPCFCLTVDRVRTGAGNNIVQSRS